jgi:transmembrane sensor
MRADETALPDATSADEAASRWLERRHFGEWNDNDQLAFETWIAQSPPHEVAYLRLEAAWARTERLVALRVSAPVAKEVKAWRRRNIASGIAVAVIMTAIGVGAPLYVWAPTEKVYTTAVGGRQTLRLADGSQIDLNTDTVLRTKFGAHERTVWLEKGEAYFQVEHDASRPFMVVAGQRRIIDLGTKFLVHREDTHLKVAVVEGLVHFKKDAQDTQPAILRPGDVAVANAGSVSIMRKPASQLASELSWREGILVFDHTTLAEAADEINRYNGKKLIVAGTDVEKLMIGGTFQVNNVMAVAEAAQDSFGLHVETRNDEIVISR